MRVRIVLGVALALVGAVVVLVLSQRSERLAGTSFVSDRSFTVFLPAHAEACQPGTYLADDSATAQLLVGTYGRARPPLTVTFADPDGRVVAHGRLAGGAREGRVEIPFARVVDGDRFGTTACIHNGGAHRIALAGDIADPSAAARIGAKPTRGVVAFRYLRAGSESWWQLAPVVAQRFGLGKTSFFGTWTLPLLALALAALWLVAIRLLLRETS